MSCVPNSTCGVNKEFEDALTDLQGVDHEYGDSVVMYLRGESAVTRDKYNSISVGDTVAPATVITVYANPIRFSPTDKELLKAGIREKVDVLITISRKDLDDNSVTYDDIDTVRSEVVIGGNTFVIKSKNLTGQYGSGFLNVTMGCFRR